MMSFYTQARVHTEHSSLSVSISSNMWSAGSYCLSPPVPNPVSVKDHRVLRVSPFTSTSSSRRRSRHCESSSSPKAPISKSQNIVITTIKQPQLSSLSSATTPPFINVVKASPELGLLSLIFVLSMAFGAIFSVGIISIPVMNAFRELGISKNKLSKVVSEEVPGTLSSFELSGLEVNELIQQLTNLRQKISFNQYGKKSTSNESSSSTNKNYR